MRVAHGRSRSRRAPWAELGQTGRLARAAHARGPGALKTGAALAREGGGFPQVASGPALAFGASLVWPCDHT